MNIGYLQPSRLYNTDIFLNKSKEKAYINLSRNFDVKYNAALKRVLSGEELITK